VVIAIISILAGLLLPALGRAMHTAKLITCTSNLKQMGVSCHTYASDYDGWYPYRGEADASVQRIEPHHLTRFWRDDRPVLRGHFEIDTQMVCPLSPLDSTISLDKSTAATATHSSYSMWFGYQMTTRVNSTGMMRVGNRPVYGGYRYNLLASDLEWHYSTINQMLTAHPDDDGFLQHLVQVGGHTASWWFRIGSPMMRGNMDRNFLRDDGSAFTLGNLTLLDTRLTYINSSKRYIPAAQ
jgi:type II secretory pathway pseudopilin PulG